ncbi:Palmitoyl-protein thioesterase 1 [Eumeta japonica]|uniref:Palmitoyl-protein thioesterase 1 n=1 Tax=Eumeta variegata TaxID=151549 RepID=A0A4C1VNX2_EUMVA|nr:Palmitoyl-protein thioesterase 1 [Eumeta japonica]
MVKYILILLVGVIKLALGDPIPIVLWHGMGDACCLPFSLGPFKTFLEKEIPGVYVLSLKIGNSIAEDIEHGYFMSPNKQVAYVCRTLTSDPNLKNGFNAIGFSQGGQFLRAVVQRCGHKIPPLKNLITLGGQHQGVYGLPNCGALKHKSCDYLRYLLNYAAYYDWMQNWLVQATYWHDPLNEDLYKKKSAFLADINNELSVNKTYIRNLNKLEHFVMVKFDNDTIVQPGATEWFGFYVPGQAKKIQNLEQSDIFLKGRLGLRKMKMQSKLVFLSTPGNHLQFSEEWFITNIVKPYLLT